MAQNEEKQKKSVCGHINRQYVNMQGVLEDLSCGLESGHSGNHKSKYTALREFSGLKNPNHSYQIWMGREYQVIEEEGEWTDAASRTADEIAAELDGKRQILQSFVNANPGMDEAHKQKARELGLIPSLRA